MLILIGFTCLILLNAHLAFVQETLTFFSFTGIGCVKAFFLNITHFRG